MYVTQAGPFWKAINLCSSFNCKMYHGLKKKKEVNFCIALLSGLHKLTVFYNSLWHFQR